MPQGFPGGMAGVRDLFAMPVLPLGLKYSLEMKGGNCVDRCKTSGGMDRADGLSRGADRQEKSLDCPDSLEKGHRSPAAAE